MKGIPIDKVHEILAKVNLDHGWNGSGFKRQPNRNIKYADMILDTRFGDVWSITFRPDNIRFANTFGMGVNVIPPDHPFPPAPGEDLYEWVTRYLDKDLTES